MAYSNALLYRKLAGSFRVGLLPDLGTTVTFPSPTQKLIEYFRGYRNRSTEGMGWVGSNPHLVERVGCSFNSVASSVKEGKQRTFLHTKALRSAGRRKGDLPRQGASSRGEVSMTEKRRSYFLNEWGLSSSGEKSNPWGRKEKSMMTSRV